MSLVSFVSVPRRPVLQQVLDQLGQLITVVTGFHQLAQRQAVVLNRGIECGKDDHWRRRDALRELVEQFGAFAVWQHQVDDGEVERLRRDQLPCVVQRSRAGQLDIQGGYLSGEQLSEVVIVLHVQDARSVRSGLQTGANHLKNP